MPVEERLTTDLRPLLFPNIGAKNRQVVELAERTSTPYVNLFDFLCPPERCRALNADGQLLYYDQVHLTHAGSQYIRDLMLGAVYAASAQAASG